MRNTERMNLPNRGESAAICCIVCSSRAVRRRRMLRDKTYCKHLHVKRLDTAAEKYYKNIIVRMQRRVGYESALRICANTHGETDMNEKDIGTIRRRFRPGKNAVGRIRGCYVNENKKIISEFDTMLGMISDDESEELLLKLRKVFTGAPGRNILNASFPTSQVGVSEEHKLLTVLRDSALSDDAAVKALFEKTAAALEREGSYMILLACDKYDILKKNDAGEDSSEMFTYVIGCICGIKNPKPALSYSLSENRLKNSPSDCIICAPDNGFMFPAFENGGADIYSALFYTRDIAADNSAVASLLFGTELPAPAAEQSESIADILVETVADNCSLELIQAIQGQVAEMNADHKASREDEPLMLTPQDLGSLLRFGGIDETTVNDFTEKACEKIGRDAAVAPETVINTKRLDIKTPEVTVKVAAENSDMVQTRVIDGTKYILIRADSDVEVNGIRINIRETPADGE